MTLGNGGTSRHDAALSEDAEPTQAASTAALTRHPLRLSNVALNAPRLLQGGNRDRSGLDVNTSGSASFGTVTQHTSARAADSGLQLRASPAAPFKRGCGGTTGNLNLAGDLAGSGGLLGAITEEGIRTEPAAGTQNTAYSSSNSSDILGGSSAHSSGSDQQQQQMSHQLTQEQQRSQQLPQGQQQCIAATTTATETQPAAVEVQAATPKMFTGSTDVASVATDTTADTGGTGGTTKDTGGVAADTGRLHHQRVVNSSSDNRNDFGARSSGKMTTQLQQISQQRQMTRAVGKDRAVGTAPAAEDLPAAAVEGPTSEGGVVHVEQQQQQQYALHTHTQSQPSVHPSDAPGYTNSTSSNGGGSGSGSMPVTPSARSQRANRREIFVSRQRAALKQYERLEEQQQTALSSPSTPAIEMEIEGIESELQRIMYDATAATIAVQSGITLRSGSVASGSPMARRLKKRALDFDCLMVAAPAPTADLAAMEATDLAAMEAAMEVAAMEAASSAQAI